jgi:histidinol-phosphate aminotransferase
VTPARIKFDLNENPFGPSPLALKAMQAALVECGLYPDNSARELRHKLARIHGIEPEQIVVAGGLTDLLGVIARTFLGPGLNAITSQRSFSHYRTVTNNAGSRLIEVPMRDDAFDLPAIADTINRDTRIVFIANPNNPTGTIVNAGQLDGFLRRVPEHVVVVLDEAYYDYAQHFAKLRNVEYSRSIDHIRQGLKIIMLRTFSKAHGLAGVRVGYGIAPADIITRIRAQRTIYCVSSLAEAAALAALDDEAHVGRTVENNAREAERIREALSGLGHLAPLPWGNFLYCELGRDSQEVASLLEQTGVLVRPLHDYGAPTAIRLTIGLPDHNEVFLHAFREVMKR